MIIKKYDLLKKSGSSVSAVQSVPKELMCRYAGKSTMLKILSRITAPTKGKVEWHSRGLQDGFVTVLSVVQRNKNISIW